MLTSITSLQDFDTAGCIHDAELNRLLVNPLPPVRKEKKARRKDSMGRLLSVQGSIWFWW